MRVVNIEEKKIDFTELHGLMVRYQLHSKSNDRPSLHTLVDKCMNIATHTRMRHMRLCRPYVSTSTLSTRIFKHL